MGIPWNLRSWLLPSNLTRRFCVEQPICSDYKSKVCLCLFLAAWMWDAISLFGRAVQQTFIHFFLATDPGAKSLKFGVGEIKLCRFEGVSRFPRTHKPFEKRCECDQFRKKKFSENVAYLSINSSTFCFISSLLWPVVNTTLRGAWWGRMPDRLPSSPKRFSPRAPLINPREESDGLNRVVLFRLWRKLSAVGCLVKYRLKLLDG